MDKETFIQGDCVAFAMTLKDFLTDRYGDKCLFGRIEGQIKSSDEELIDEVITHGNDTDKE